MVSYGKFLVASTNQHGVHSPFVFRLVTKCLYQNNILPSYLFWKNYRQTLVQNSKGVLVNDFEEASKVFSYHQHKASAIAKHFVMHGSKAKLLIKLVQYFQPTQVLEIGTSLGLGTYALHLGNPNAMITTIEGCEKTLAIAKANWQKNQSNAIHFVFGDFKEVFPKLPQEKWDFIFFNGNHSKKDILSFEYVLLPSITNETICVFNNIHWNNEMEAAWEAIKNHPKVTVTIDLFCVGLVFFRTEQAKEHFVIRA